MVIEIWLYFAIFMYWFSTALTEGWKWRVSKGIADNCPLITVKSYHVWRIVTTLSVIIAVIFPVIAVINELSVTYNIQSLFSWTVFSWLFYERLMRYVDMMDIMGKAEDFKILNFTISRASPKTEVIVIAISLIYSIISFF